MFDNDSSWKEYITDPGFHISVCEDCGTSFFDETAPYRKCPRCERQYQAYLDDEAYQSQKDEIAVRDFLDSI